MSSFLIETTDDPNVISVNGVEFHSNDQAPPEPIPDPVMRDPITWEQFTGQPTGTEDNGSYYPVPGLAAGIVHMRVVQDGERAFDADVVYGMSAGWRVTRVGAERERWAATGGNEDIVAKIDAMGLSDDDFACFPHGNGVRDLPFYPVAFKDGEHGTFYVTDRNGVTQPIKFQFREPATAWVVTNTNPQGPLHLRNSFDA